MARMLRSARIAGAMGMIAALLAAPVGCKKDDSSEAQKPAGQAAKKVDWETPKEKGAAEKPADGDLADEWPIDAPSGGTEFAKAGGKKVDDIRQAILKFEGVHLNGWADVLGSTDAPAEEVQAALTELMSAVTGPGGLWTRIPNQWFGCGANADSAPCAAFAKARPHLAKWEKFQVKLDAAPKSARFLKKSHGKIMKYIKLYVPSGKSLSAVQQTGFFKDNIAAAL